MSYIDEVKSVKISLKEVNSDLICFGVYKDKSMTPLGNEIDENLKQTIDSAIEVGDIKGKNGEVNFFYVNDHRYALIGLGEKENIDSNSIRLATGSAIRAAISKKAKTVTLDCFCSGLDSCQAMGCLLYTSPSPRDRQKSRMPSSA